MNRVLATILGQHLASKLVHKWMFFMHKSSSKKIVYGLPSFLVGSGVGYCAGLYKNTVDQHIRYRANDRTKVETEVETDQSVASAVENPTETTDSNLTETTDGYQTTTDRNESIETTTESTTESENQEANSQN